MKMILMLINSCSDDVVAMVTIEMMGLMMRMMLMNHGDNNDDE